MRSLELFSGAGGLALGLEAAEFEPVAFIEWDRDACETLRRNRPNWNVIEGDVSKIDFSQFSEVDLVAGGPPCQPFSVGGKARGFRDRRDMFPAAVEAVRALAPAAFVFENVRGLLRPAFQNYVEFIRLQMTHPQFPVSRNLSWEQNLARLERHHTSRDRTGELTYKVSVHDADAANFGVPQRRHRVFFVGFRSDLNAEWSFPMESHSRSELVRAKDVTGEYWSEHGIPKAHRSPRPKASKIFVNEEFAEISGRLARWRTVRDAICNLGDPRKESEFSDHVFQNGARSYPGHTGSPLDEPAKALKAGDHGVPGGENMLRHPNGRVRYFTVREAARIQTFPDDWKFSGSWTEVMRQLGNAVPVQLGEAVARSVAKAIKRAKRKIKSEATIDR
ncbi:MAG: DNA cytosine methyltransferase [Verrucomicrobiae bacterium]|nr:DNA cytosine methyltransferase [Verrucomicrobiae bacterium]